MEEQETLDTEIGTKEAERLKPEKVKIVKIEIQKVGAAGNEKLVCFCKHPEKEELIQISEVKYERSNKKLEAVGLWINKDEDGKIRKGSSVAVFMNTLKVSTLRELGNKEAETAQDESGYLCFKAY